MRATASYSYEGLIARDIEPCTADRDGVSAIGCESEFLPYNHPQGDSNLGPKDFSLLEFEIAP